MKMEQLVRTEEFLRVKIGEAKNLAGRANTSSTTKDVYCTVALDQEEICRTQSQRNQAPFFGEEFSFEIPRKFRYLSVYVLERDRHLKQDKAIGKIAIRRGDLHLYNHKDHWFPLRPVDDDSEVQGMAQIEVKIIDSDDDHSKENFKSTSNNYTTTTILSPATNHQTSNHKAPKLLHSTHTSSLVQRSSSQQDVSLKQQGNFLRVPYTNSFHQNQRIQVRLKACSDLTKKNNQCDPYATITALYTNKRKITRRTKVRKKTIHPTFDEVVEFNLYDFTHGSGSHGTSDSKIYTVTPFGGNDLCEIVVQLWHSAGMAEDNFLGEVRLSARGKQELQYLQQSAWYFLLPRSSQSRPAKSCATPPGTRLSCENSLGSLRLKLHYQADHVFPLANYDQLLNLLIQSVEQRPITTSAVYLLGEMVANKQEIAQPLVRLFTHNKRIVDIIQRLAEYEICKLTDPTTIFRGNTLVSKMMDEAMKLSGLHYLHSTLRPIVELILHEKKCCEIDPARINREKTSIEQNLNNLHDYVEKVFDAIIRSANKCPRVLCDIFYNMRESATKYFPQNKEVRYSVVSGFIFLRFFAPAILGPKLFDLTAEPLDSQTNRTLTLISKTIQSLGNLVSSRSAQQHAKEEFTVELYKKFCTEKHVEAVKRFLDVISCSTKDSRDVEACGHEPILLKDGMMTKHAQNRKRFGRRNFKQRYFRLTTHTLSYAKAKGKRPICDIPLTELAAVERLEEKSFKLQNIFRITRKDRPLYIQTANCVEEKKWVDLLSKICENNKRRLDTFHPCAFINGEWTCCNERDQNANGCKAVDETPLEVDLVTQLDPARDLQRLHSLIIGNMNVMTKFFDTNMPKNEETEFTRQTLRRLSEEALKLDQIQRNHRNKQLKDLKVGSKQEPIGDDNYIRGVSSSNLNSGSSTTPRPVTTTNQHFDLPPTLFQRGHFLRNSDGFSHF
ncbi:hypothetical protein ACKWTF_008647 [Chironomus riparius]